MTDAADHPDEKLPANGQTTAGPVAPNIKGSDQTGSIPLAGSIPVQSNPPRSGASEAGGAGEIDGEFREFPADPAEAFSKESIRADAGDMELYDLASETNPTDPLAHPFYPTAPQPAIPLSPVRRKSRRKPQPADHRVRMDEPLPVELIAVDDVHVEAQREHLPAMEALYLRLLGMVRADETSADLTADECVYYADNFCLVIHWIDGPTKPKEDYRPIKLVVPLLRDFRQGLIDREIEHQYQLGMVPGSHCIVLMDAAGNWLNVYEKRELR